jgi:DNA (cytosine-5)-methyltransferase 1
MVLKYISLFSGIGGFEVAIQRLHPRAVCIGYSEIDSNAISVYNANFPKHANLGDITKISMDTLSATIKRAGGVRFIGSRFPVQ